MRGGENSVSRQGYWRDTPTPPSHASRLYDQLHIVYTVAVLKHPLYLMIQPNVGNSRKQEIVTEINVHYEPLVGCDGALLLC